MTDFAHSLQRPQARRRFRVPQALGAVGLAAVLLITVLASGPTTLPHRLSDAEFWHLSSDFSESGGVFPSRNYVSNETEFQSVIPTLRETVKPGGVYIGVGPDQNFTYIAALQPAVAFIVDIRRDNLVHHLLYKALIELSPDRATFVERLFSRPRHPGDPEFDDARGILDAAQARAPDEAAYRQNLRDVLRQLQQVHGFSIAPPDQVALDSIYSAFYRFGPEITYAPQPVNQANGFRLPTPFPSYADLMTRADRDGTNWGYLASAEQYTRLRDMQQRNLIVPVVGDFAGPKALRAVGDWVRSKQAVVTTLYVSNVEQYLFQNGVWHDYYDSVATMPTDGTSTFIRSHFPRGAIIQGPARVIAPGGQLVLVRPPARIGGSGLESSTLLDSVQDLLHAVQAHEIETYPDVIARSR